MTLAVALLFTTAGCIEVKERPPEGPFTILLDVPAMYFVDEGEGMLEGPHATVETDIAHAHEGYAWDIEGLGEFEGTEADLPDHDVGVMKAWYQVHFLEEENHTGTSVATVPDLSADYLVIGDGIGLAEGDEGTQTLDLELSMGQNLSYVDSDEGWTVMEYAGSLSNAMTVSLLHNGSNQGTVTYLVGVHIGSTDPGEETVGAIEMNPGELHRLTYLDGQLNVTIYEDYIVAPGLNQVYDGSYHDLPAEYRTHIGHLDWEGHIGEVEEAPGFGMLLSLGAVVAVAVVLVGRRR